MGTVSPYLYHIDHLEFNKLIQLAEQNSFVFILRFQIDCLERERYSIIPMPTDCLTIHNADIHILLNSNRAYNTKASRSIPFAREETERERERTESNSVRTFVLFNDHMI